MTGASEPDLASLFAPEPDQWGLRGCPHLWAELTESYRGAPATVLPAQFVVSLTGRVAGALGVPLSLGEVTFVDGYARGGMSSGQVDHAWWIETAIPLLQERLQRLNRDQFLEREFAAMSIIAGFATRDRLWPVYGDADTQGRDETKALVRQLLFALGHRYADTVPDEMRHVIEIAAFAEEVTEARGHCLHLGTLRFGVAQKVVNLYLKYLWLAGLCAEPPHCPIDGIVRDRAGLSYSWTRSDDVDEYWRAIADLKGKAGSDTLAVWELSEFQRSR